jgi:hypothetical protein
MRYFIIPLLFVAILYGIGRATHKEVSASYILVDAYISRQEAKEMRAKFLEPWR